MELERAQVAFLVDCCNLRRGILDGTDPLFTAKYDGQSMQPTDSNTKRDTGTSYRKSPRMRCR